MKHAVVWVVVAVAALVGGFIAYTSEGRYISECRVQGGMPMRFKDGTTICLAGTTKMLFPTDKGPTI